MKRFIKFGVLAVLVLFAGFGFVGCGRVNETVGYGRHFNINQHSSNVGREFVITGDWIYGFRATIRNDSNETRHVVIEITARNSNGRSLGRQSQTLTFNAGQSRLVSIDVRTGNTRPNSASATIRRN